MGLFSHPASSSPRSAGKNNSPQILKRNIMWISSIVQWLAIPITISMPKKQPRHIQTSPTCWGLINESRWGLWFIAYGLRHCNEAHNQLQANVVLQEMHSRLTTHAMCQISFELHIHRNQQFCPKLFFSDPTGGWLMYALCVDSIFMFYSLLLVVFDLFIYDSSSHPMRGWAFDA